MDFSSRSISATMVPQFVKNETNDILFALVPIRFDATEKVLSLSAHDIAELVSGVIGPKDLEIDLGCFVPKATLGRFVEANPGAAYRIEGLRASTSAFFSEDGKSIADPDRIPELLEEARAAQVIGKDRIYEVMVTRTEVRHVMVAVEATSEDDAYEKTRTMLTSRADEFEADFMSQKATQTIRIKEVNPTLSLPAQIRTQHPRG